jgi:hypothetical protein
MEQLDAKTERHGEMKTNPGLLSRGGAAVLSTDIAISTGDAVISTLS